MSSCTEPCAVVPSPAASATEIEVLRETAMVERHMREKADAEVERIRGVAARGMAEGAKRVRGLQHLCQDLEAEAKDLRSVRVKQQLDVDELTVTLRTAREEQFDSNFLARHTALVSACDRSALCVRLEESDARCDLALALASTRIPAAPRAASPTTTLRLSSTD